MHEITIEVVFITFKVAKIDELLVFLCDGRPCMLRLTWEKIQLLLAILDYYFNGFLKKFQVLFLLSTTILTDFLKNYYFKDFFWENYYFKGYFGKLLLF